MRNVAHKALFIWSQYVPEQERAPVLAYNLLLLFETELYRQRLPYGGCESVTIRRGWGGGGAARGSRLPPLVSLIEYSYYKLLHIGQFNASSKHTYNGNLNLGFHNQAPKRW